MAVDAKCANTLKSASRRAPLAGQLSRPEATAFTEKSTEHDDIENAAVGITRLRGAPQNGFARRGQTEGSRPDRFVRSVSAGRFGIRSARTANACRSIAL
jgi:hypothetical protein